MSEHKAIIAWTRNTKSFDYKDYDRRHSWRFEGGIEVLASAAPPFLGNAECVDPEEAMVASISSCHMLTFLAIASRKRFVVDRYVDNAVGVLERNMQGKLALTRVTLSPSIRFGGDARPTAEEIEEMHRRSHEECFIANSVTTEISVRAVNEEAAPQRH